MEQPRRDLRPLSALLVELVGLVCVAGARAGGALEGWAPLTIRVQGFFSTNFPRQSLGRSSRLPIQIESKGVCSPAASLLASSCPPSKFLAPAGGRGLHARLMPRPADCCGRGRPHYHRYRRRNIITIHVLFSPPHRFPLHTPCRLVCKLKET